MLKTVLVSFMDVSQVLLQSFIVQVAPFHLVKVDVAGGRRSQGKEGGGAILACRSTYLSV